jgi:hypothetical protein
VWLSVPTQVSGIGDAVVRVDDRRHPLQVDLVHDAVARRNHVDVAGTPACVQSMKWKRSSLRRSSIGAVLREGVRIEAAALHRQRVVDDQLQPARPD